MNFITIRKQDKTYGGFYCLAMNLQNNTFTLFCTRHAYKEQYGLLIEVSTMKELDFIQIDLEHRGFSLTYQEQFYNIYKEQKED